ncbi:MAG: hypothetical protein LBL79_10495 [Prevotella sp.]|nr:hypothetical protein [Prevotella sp.]
MSLISLYALPLSASKPVKWDNTLSLPAINGQVNSGVGGAYSGFIGDLLVIAGGSNFPEGMPWEDGRKVWHSTLYFIDTKDAGSCWTIVENALPVPLGYGVSIQLPDGLLCIGGCDSSQCYSNMFEIKLKEGKLSLSHEWPSLPVPLANMTGTLVDNKIYIAGGQESMEKQEATNHFFMLDISNKKQGWTVLPSWPGEARGFSVCAAQSNGLANCFYLFSGRNYKGDDVKILSDGYCYNPTLNSWKKLDGRFPVMAGTALAADTNHILLFGGAQQIIPGSYHHPGFDKTLRLYNTATNTMVEKETIPYPVAVTTNAIQKGNTMYITSGEIKPGIRTPVILRGIRLND